MGGEAGGLSGRVRGKPTVIKSVPLALALHLFALLPLVCLCRGGCRFLFFRFWVGLVKESLSRFPGLFCL